MIFRRYIHREILAKLGWITGLLLLVLTSNRFVDYLADAAAGDLPADLLFQILVMKMLADPAKATARRPVSRRHPGIVTPVQGQGV